MARFMPEGWPIPALDRFNKEYFTAGKLLVQECKKCGNIQWPPEHVCFKCREMDFGWKETNGRGTVYSYMVIHHPAAPTMASIIPYTVALVALEEYPQVRILGNVLNRKYSEVSIGQKVRVTFEEIEDKEAEATIKLPQWEAID